MVAEETPKPFGIGNPARTLKFRAQNRISSWMKVSVLILTYNEEANISACLSALSWCDDIVVLDSGSEDKTVEIAKAYGARILTRPFDTFADQRNWGLDNGKFVHQWVLHLDADEVVTDQFVMALENLRPIDGIDAYHVAAKTMFYGKWLRHAGMWPSYQVRLGRRDTLRFVQVGHGQREDLPNERIGLFPEPYLHYSFSRGLKSWLERHLRYADAEVRQLETNRLGSGDVSGRSGGVTSVRRKLKGFVARLPLAARPFLKFCYVFFLRLGFLDGRRGFAYAFMLAVYEGMIAVIGFDKLGKIGPRGSNSPPQNSEQPTDRTRSK